MRKSAVITGSTSGIGKGVADALAASGVNIVLNGFGDTDAIEAQRADLEEKYGITAVYNGANMTKANEIRAMMATAAETFGSVDIVVNNAGIQHVSPIDEFPTEKWDAIIAINLTSAFHTTAAALPIMRKTGWGRVVNIASAHGLVASPFKSAYVAAKHGILGLTKTTALETAQDGITCNAICPGYVRTPLVEAQIPDTAKARGITEEEVVRDVILSAQPTKSFVGLEELGALTVFLCSDAAKSFTGASLPVDGGWTAK
ncbi:MAG: 3-hydroxybutyrate dehydrogenase [Amylibacter sp.]|nr:3-hydroxybutyrate dehydrogenase [Amylibacter sp.]|tara:strand:- start:18 stop:794 length:777 start_codon:yes stop_codon:yes gene_type:complete